MKRRDLVKYLKNNACFLVREGGNHSIFENTNLDLSASVPRHREINNFTVVEICKQLRIPKPNKF